MSENSTETETEAPAPAFTSREEYEVIASRVIDGLISLFEDEHRGWCRRRHMHFRHVIPGYTPDGFSWEGGSMTSPKWSWEPLSAPEDGNFAPLLAAVRPKMLWYAKREVVTLDEANAIIRLAGQEPFGLPDAPVEHEFEIGLVFTISIRRDAVSPGSSEIRQFLNDAVTAYQAPDGEKFIPSTFRVTELTTYSASTDEYVNIPDSETFHSPHGED